jgi:hypothetical protein
MVTLIRASDSAIEVIKVTNITGTTWTIVRAQEGTTALNFVAGDKVELRVTAGFLQGLQFGRLLNVRVITSNQTYVETPGTKKCYIIGTGGGGGGGGCPATAAGELAASLSGQSGTAAEGWYDVSVVSGKLFATGAGGAGGAGGMGSTGGTSSIDGGAVMNCPGGPGGAAGVATAATVLIVEAALGVVSATGGNVCNWDSRRQSNGFASTTTKGLSMGGVGIYGNDGGMGSASIPSSSPKAGTAGVAGRFVIYEYA